MKYLVVLGADLPDVTRTLQAILVVGQRVSAALQIAQLEAVADQAVLLESRIEAAESERDEALERARVYTPRPTPFFHSADPPLNDAAAAMLAEVVEVYRWVLVRCLESDSSKR